MRFRVLALVLGAASMCGGCIQTEPDGEESVQAAEQHIFSDPPPKTGIWLSPTVRPALSLRPTSIPVAKAQPIAFAESATLDTEDGDDDTDKDVSKR